MKIVTRQPINVEAIHGIAEDAEIASVETDEELLRESKDAEIVVGIGPSIFEELVKTSKSLRWVHTSVAGADRFVTPALAAGRIVLTCAKGGPAGRNLAEHAIGLALALSRNIGRSARMQSWQRRELSAGAYELSGTTFGIAGFGASGRDLAELSSGFRTRIVATKRTGPYSETDRLRVLPPTGFDELLGESDVVFDFLPSTEATDRVFDLAAFEKMKREALFVNVGRGSTVDTDALVEALGSGLIAGAGIDTVDPEPLPAGHPLWSMPNVIISPHIAGVSPKRRTRNEELFLENLARFVANEPLQSVVDPKAGY
jgi:phosphoglycerate dehydrogenase-like enzyme